MRAAWSLALVAGGVPALAAPSFRGEQANESGEVEEVWKAWENKGEAQGWSGEGSRPSPWAQPPAQYEDSSSEAAPVYGSSSSSASTVTVTLITTALITVCPTSSVYTPGATTFTDTYQPTSNLTSIHPTNLTVPAYGSPSPPSASSPAGPIEGSPSRAPAYSSLLEMTGTELTTVYTTYCSATETYSSGGTSVTTTYMTNSTITSVYSTTVPVSPISSSATEYGSIPWTLTDSASDSSAASVPPQYGSIPLTYSTTTDSTSTHATVSSASSAGPVGGSSSSVDTTGTEFAASARPYSGSTSSTPYYSSGGNASSSGAVYPTGGTGSLSAYSNLTASYSGSPSSPAGPVVTGGSSGTISISINSTSSAPYRTGVYTPPSYDTGSNPPYATGGYGAPVHGSGSLPPYGTGMYTPPIYGTGTAPAPTTTYSSSTSTHNSTTISSTLSAKPTPSCIPCDGQPSNNPDDFCGYDINSNYYEVMPKTCRTVEYDFTITNGTIAPDGVARQGLLINGQMPGPKIEASWGDIIVVHVHNMLQNNGTSLHFHGMRQNYTNQMDGVSSITQCPLAPGESMTYRFKATNYGTSWYHSHFGLQTYEGVFGPMVIHGPHSDEYDVDTGVVLLQDWSHISVDQMYDAAQTVGPPPQNGPRTLDTGLINGLNVFGADGAANQTGSRFELPTAFEPGKKYLIRLVNVAIQSTFKFHIDGHKFKVISTDFVPIVPYETSILNINIGQRYNIIVNADQEPGDYWVRSDNQQSCAQLTNARDIKGIVHYAGFSGTPTSTAYTYTDECIDEPYESLVPVVALMAGAEDTEIEKTVLIGAGPNTPNLFKWTLDGNTFSALWDNPTLGSVYNNGTIPTDSGNLAIEIPDLKEWVYIIIQSPIPLPHPIHLHGHDFFILAQGVGAYDATVVLNTNNPPRRDVALMPSNGVSSGGYLVLAFETDNPGVWLMHCHIGWHATMGFALQIIENLDGIRDTVSDPETLNGTCDTFRSYATANDMVTNDSGI